MDIKPKNLLKRVLQFAREELDRRARTNDSSLPPASPDDGPDVAPYARHDGLLDPELAYVEAGEPQVHGLEVGRTHGGALTLRWSVSEAQVARAQRLISGGNPVLCLRLVSFSKARDDVLREVQDRPGIERVGACEIGEPAQRAVVSLGLRAGERFVSIAHHII